MKLRNLSTIISREYLTRIRKKSFLLITILGPVFFAAVAVLPSIILMLTDDTRQEVAVIDSSGIVIDRLTEDDTIGFTDCTGEDADSMKMAFSDMGYDVLLTISPLDSAGRSVDVAAYSVNPLSVDVKESLSSRIDDAVEDYRIGLYKVSDLKSIMEDVKSDISIATYTVGDDGKEQITSSEVYMVISMVLAMIVYMFIMMFSGMVMQSVIEEKASRVVEVLVSSVKATELMFGKIIGVACVALTQFLLWVVLTVVLVAGAGAVMGLGNIDPAMTGEIMEMANMGGTEMSDMTSYVAEDGLSAVMSTLRQLDYVHLIVGFMIYFILGYLLYASLFAAIGSAVENEADTTQLQMPVTVPLLIAFFIAFYAFKAPDCPVVFWGSMIPFTSPIVMLARIPFGVPAWELALSVGLLFGTFVLCGWASAKIYKIGILMFGKKTTFSDLWKWLKQR